uniref:ZSWIM3 N-terminal domain-containing protein n=1 Tax=Parascaris univalens TaxID=6257 RepID=A0A914ZRD4_PARUN
MAASLDQLAAVAQFELAAKMQSIVDMYGTVNRDENKDEERWPLQTPTNSVPEHDDEEMEHLSPLQQLNVQSDSTDNSSAIPVSIAITDTANTSVPSSMPPDLPCSVIVPSSGFSDGGIASHTPSSVDTSPSLSNEGSQTEATTAGESSAISSGNIEELLKTFTNGTNNQGGVSSSSCGISVEVKQGVIATGARFNSFAEFDYAFDVWKQMYHHPFRVASSETLRQPDGTANETFKYRYIVYHCAHYGQPRMRGVGKRPNQNYLPCGCRAMLRLNFNWAENALRITTLNDQHTGHDLSADSYAKIASKIRRCSPTSATPERSPVIRRPQAQHPLRNPSVENALNSGSSALARSPSAAATPPPSKTPLSLLAQNVAQVGCKQEPTESSSQNGHMSGGSQSSGALQNLAAVAAAINHQQQMAAVALFAHHKENMSFGFPNASMLPPSATPGPQLLPLIRGMLGLPNFPSPLLLPTLQPLTTNSEAQQQIGTLGNAPRPAISTASPPATVPTTNGAIPTSTHQQSSPFVTGYIGSQPEHLAAALSLAQQLRAQHFVPHAAPAPLQPNVVPPTSLMSVHAAVPTSQASVPLAHAATPIDLSTAPAPSTPNSGDQRLQEVSRVLQTFISSLLQSPNDDEYKKRLLYLKSLQKIWQAANLQLTATIRESHTVRSPSD